MTKKGIEEVIKFISRLKYDVIYDILYKVIRQKCEIVLIITNTEYFHFFGKP